MMPTSPLVRAALGEEAFSAAWAEGRAMTFEQAVEYTLRQDEARPPIDAAIGIRRRPADGAPVGFGQA